MRSILFAFGIVVGCQYAVGAKPESIDDRATHRQTAVIKIADEDNPLKINSFCLDAKGRIVAACGSGPGEIRIVGDDGKILNSWAIDVKPEAVNVADDGAILVGGEGKLFRFSETGNQLYAVDSPHATKLRNSKQELRKVAIANLERQRNPLKARILSYENIIKQLEERAAKGELNDTETNMLKVLPKTLERYKEQQAKLNKDNPFRLRFGELLGHNFDDPVDIEFIRYMVPDAVHTIRTWKAQGKRCLELAERHEILRTVFVIGGLGMSRSWM